MIINQKIMKLMNLMINLKSNKLKKKYRKRKFQKNKIHLKK